MDIKMLASQIILISSLLCSSISNSDVYSYNNQVYNYDIDWNTIYDVDESQLVAEIPNSNIKLYYI
ncbi:hypothetical protein [Clostridium sp.]|jgi:hypothetical protein|uniref:hypothetical protein n=1 Tax=Clostridium sp. TaxID=1506 RepID=UPI002586618B|nr:hypothetical protein [Clostridium sp.]MDF2506062.1 hypothetical protein [Clostridium sp.]